MDIPNPLRQAAVMVPRWATSEAGTTVVVAIDYLHHYQYEIAFDIPTAALGDAYAAEPAFWNLQADARRPHLDRRGAPTGTWRLRAMPASPPATARRCTSATRGGALKSASVMRLRRRHNA